MTANEISKNAKQPGPLLKAVYGDKIALWKLMQSLSPGQGLRVTNAGKIVPFQVKKRYPHLYRRKK